MSKRNRRASFRCDATARTGAGHVSRCLALAEAMEQSGWQCAFYCSPETEQWFPDLLHSGVQVTEVECINDSVDRIEDSGGDGLYELLVIDSYDLSEEYESRHRNVFDQVLVIDDLPRRAHDCDFLLDSNPGRGPADYKALVDSRCRLLLGPQYALLRQRFTASRERSLARRRERKRPRRLLISLGATSRPDLYELILEAIGRSGPGLTIDCVFSRPGADVNRIKRLADSRRLDVRVHVSPADLPGLLCAADLAIGAGGVSAWERCCLGLPSILFSLAENQNALIEFLAASGAAVAPGGGATPTLDEVTDAINVLRGDPEFRARLSESSAALCDGLGAWRVTGILDEALGCVA